MEKVKTYCIKINIRLILYLISEFLDIKCLLCASFKICHEEQNDFGQMMPFLILSPFALWLATLSPWFPFLRHLRIPLYDLLPCHQYSYPKPSLDLVRSSVHTLARPNTETDEQSLVWVRNRVWVAAQWHRTAVSTTQLCCWKATDTQCSVQRLVPYYVKNDRISDNATKPDHHWVIWTRWRPRRHYEREHILCGTIQFHLPTLKQYI